MESVNKLVEEYGTSKNWKDSTKKDYLKSLKMIGKAFDTEDFHALFTNDYEKVYKTLKEKYVKNTHIANVNVYCKFYDIKVTKPQSDTESDNSAPNTPKKTKKTKKTKETKETKECECQTEPIEFDFTWVKSSLEHIIKQI